MGALSIELGEVSLRLPRRMENARGGVVERRALQLRVEGAGALGCAEAAPLEGFSREGIDEVRAALRGLSCLASDDPLAEAARANPAAPPSARFALEAALLDHAGRRAGAPAASLLGARGGTLRSVALIDQLEDAPARAADALRDGATGVKLKVGRPGRASEEARALSAVRRELGEAALVRADANGSLGEAGALFDALAFHGVDYVEEPWPVERLLEAATPLPFPVALDESVPRAPERCLEAIRRGLAAALVIKPTRLGIARSLELGREVRRLGGRVVVGHLFEPPRAFAALAHVALALDPDETHGLAAYPGIDAWEDAGGERLTGSACAWGFAIDLAGAEGLG